MNDTPLTQRHQQRVKANGTCSVVFAVARYHVHVYELLTADIRNEIIMYAFNGNVSYGALLHYNVCIAIS